MNEQQVVANLDRVRERIAEACLKAGRPVDSVRLVAVSKRIPLPLVVAACQAGQWDLGENRVLNALDRQEELARLLADVDLDPSRVNWHFIGHLQSNKAGRAAGRFSLLHGIDSLKLATRLSTNAVQQHRSEPVLFEVNVAREPQKHGLLPEALPDVFTEAARLPGLDLQGLMAMAPYGADDTELHRTFSGLRELAEHTRQSTGLLLPELSMGMSGDFETAIAEGATMIRVGSAIFGTRQTP